MGRWVHGGVGTWVGGAGGDGWVHGGVGRWVQGGWVHGWVHGGTGAWGHRGVGAGGWCCVQGGLCGGQHSPMQCVPCVLSQKPLWHTHV